MNDVRHYKVERVYTGMWQVISFGDAYRIKVVAECPSREAAENAARLLSMDAGG